MHEVRKRLSVFGCLSVKVMVRAIGADEPDGN
jgi:hypothetical protein